MLRFAEGKGKRAERDEKDERDEGDEKGGEGGYDMRRLISLFYYKNIQQYVTKYFHSALLSFTLVLSSLVFASSTMFLLVLHCLVV